MSNIVYKLKMYRSLCQKGNDENYIIDQMIVRKISIFFTIPFIMIGARPNQITLLSLLSLIFSFYFFLLDSPIMILTGALLVFIYYILDHVDGELARYYNNIEPEKKKTLDGQYFDVLCHAFSGNIIIFLFGISAWKIFGYEWAILLSFFIAVCKNSSPEMVANKIMVQAIANQPSLLNNDSIKRALKFFEMKKIQIAAVRAPITDPKKLSKLAKELLGFPGYLILIIITAFLDAFLSNFTLLSHPMNFRLLLILFLFPIELLRLFVLFFKFFNLFKHITIT